MLCIMLTPVPWWPAPPPGADNTQCVIVVQVNTVNTGHRAVLAGSRVPTLWWHSTFYKYPHLSPGDNEEIGLEKMFLFMNGCKNVKISQIVSAFTFPSPNICTINGKVQIFPTWNFAGHVNTRYWYSHSAAPMPPTSCFLPLGWGECNDKCRLLARPSLLCSSVARRPGPLSTIYTIAQMTHFGEFMIITFYPSVKFLPVTLIYRLYYISLPLVQRASWTRPDDETIYFCSWDIVKCVMLYLEHCDL